MSDIIPPSPIGSPFGSYNWADWYEKVRRVINDAQGTIAVTQGGTGITSYTIGDLIYASGTTTLSKLPDVATGNALISGGVGAAPSWGKISLTGHITGNLPVTNLNGGTLASTATFWRGDGTWSDTLASDINVGGDANITGNAVVTGVVQGSRFQSGGSQTVTISGSATVLFTVPDPTFNGTLLTVYDATTTGMALLFVHGTTVTVLTSTLTSITFSIAGGDLKANTTGGVANRVLYWVRVGT